MQSQEMGLRVSMSTVEWYTPEWLVDAARTVMGQIDFDPASCLKAQEWIRAKQWCGLDHPDEYFRDGLSINWLASTVWLNPPYGKIRNKSSQDIWTSKLIAEMNAGRVEEGIALINSYCGYPWYEKLVWNRASCLLRDLTRFVGESGVQGGKAKVGQTVVYFGKDIDGFEKEFHHYGRVIRPQGREWVKQSYYHQDKLAYLRQPAKAA